MLLTIWAGPIGTAVDPRWLIVVGTGLTFLAFQWFARLGGSPLEYYAAWCVYMLGYFLSGPIPHQIILSQWYKVRRGRAMGIAYVGGAVLGALGNFLNPWLVTFLPYTRALEISGYVLLLAWPVAIFVLRDSPEEIGQTPDGLPVDTTAEPPIPLQAFRDLLQRRAFWLLLMGSAASIGSIATVNFLMKFVFEEQGFTDQAARNQIWRRPRRPHAHGGDRRPPARGPHGRSCPAAAVDARHLCAGRRRDRCCFSSRRRSPDWSTSLRWSRARDGRRLC